MDAHPDEIDVVFRALADPSRRRLLDSLNERGGQTLRDSAPNWRWLASRCRSTSRRSKPPCW